MVITEKAVACRIEPAFEEIRAGRAVVITGRRHGTELGVMVAAAADLTMTTLGFMLANARGPLYAMLEAARLVELGMSSVTTAGRVASAGAYFLPVNAATCTANGLSVTDRLRTIHRLAAPEATPRDFVGQGQVTPIGARQGGVLERAGQTEAAVDIVRLTGLTPAAVGCAVVATDGSLATPSEVSELATTHGLAVLSIQDIVSYRRAREDVLDRTREISLPFAAGRFRVVAFRDRYEPGEHLAVVAGDISAPGAVTVYVHAECVNGDVFGSHSCACGAQLAAALDTLSRSGAGVLVYMRAARGDTARFVHRPFPATTEVPTVDDRVSDELDQARDGVLRSILTNLGLTEDRTHLIPTPA